MKTVSERLQYALIVRGISQSELARKIGVTRGAISNLKNNVSSGLSAENALKIAEVLNIDPYWLVFGKGEGPVSSKEINSESASPRDAARELINNIHPSTIELVVKVLKQFHSV